MLAVLVFPGCGTYQLGSMLPSDIKTIYIPTFVNKTEEPMIETEITRSVMQEFQKDGSLKLASTPESADVILNASIVKYTLVPVAYDSQKTTTAQNYRLYLTCSIVVTRRTNGKVVVENPSVQGDALIPVIGDFTSSKRIGLTPAAQDLAQHLVNTVTEAW